MSDITSIFEQKNQRQQAIVDGLRDLDKRTGKPGVHSTEGQNDFLVYFTDVKTDHTEPDGILRLTEAELNTAVDYFSTQTGKLDRNISKKLAAGQIALANAKAYAAEDQARPQNLSAVRKRLAL